MKLLSLAVLAIVAISAASAAAPPLASYESYNYTYIKPTSPYYPTAVKVAKYSVEVTNKYHSLKVKLLDKDYKEGYDYTYGDVKEASYAEDDKHTYYKISVYSKYDGKTYTYDYTVRYNKAAKKAFVLYVKYKNVPYYGPYGDTYSFELKEHSRKLLDDRSDVKAPAPYDYRYAPNYYYVEYYYPYDKDVVKYAKEALKALHKNKDFFKKVVSYYSYYKGDYEYEQEYEYEHDYTVEKVYYSSAYYTYRFLYKLNIGGYYYEFEIAAYITDKEFYLLQVAYPNKPTYYPYPDKSIKSGDRKLLDDKSDVKAPAPYDYRYAPNYYYVEYYYPYDKDVVKYAKEALKALHKNKDFFKKVVSYYSYYKGKYEYEQEYEYEHDYTVEKVYYSSAYYTYRFLYKLNIGGYYYEFEIAAYITDKEFYLLQVAYPNKPTYYPYYTTKRA